MKTQAKTATAQGTFAVGVSPVNVTGVTATGTRNFCVATDGVVYAYTTATTATKTSGGGTAAAICTVTGGVVVQ